MLSGWSLSDGKRILSMLVVKGIKHLFILVELLRSKDLLPFSTFLLHSIYFSYFYQMIQLTKLMWIPQNKNVASFRTTHMLIQVIWQSLCSFLGSFATNIAVLGNEHCKH